MRISAYLQRHNIVKMMMMINVKTPQWLRQNLRDLLGVISSSEKKHCETIKQKTQQSRKKNFFLVISSSFVASQVSLCWWKWRKLLEGERKGKKRVSWLLRKKTFHWIEWKLETWLHHISNVFVTDSFLQTKIATNFLLLHYVPLMEMKWTCVWERNLHKSNDERSVRYHLVVRTLTIFMLWKF